MVSSSFDGHPKMYFRLLLLTINTMPRLFRRQSKWLPLFLCKCAEADLKRWSTFAWAWRGLVAAFMNDSFRSHLVFDWLYFPLTQGDFSRIRKNRLDLKFCLTNSWKARERKLRWLTTYFYLLLRLANWSSVSITREQESFEPTKETPGSKIKQNF